MPFPGTANQPSHHQTPRNKLLDSQDTSMGSAKPWLALHTGWWLKAEASQPWSQWHLTRQLSWDVRTRPGCLLRAVCVYSYFHGKKMPSSTLPQAPPKRGNLFFMCVDFFRNSLIMIQWQINFSLAFSEGWEGSRVPSLSSELLCDSGFLSKFTVSEFANLQAVLLDNICFCKPFFWDNNTVLIHLLSSTIFAKSSIAIALCVDLHCAFPNVLGPCLQRAPVLHAILPSPPFSAGTFRRHAWFCRENLPSKSPSVPTHIFSWLLSDLESCYRTTIQFGIVVTYSVL